LIFFPHHPHRTFLAKPKRSPKLTGSLLDWVDVAGKQALDQNFVFSEVFEPGGSYFDGHAS
jgi:hypothetical protein